MCSHMEVQMLNGQMNIIFTVIQIGPLRPIENQSVAMSSPLQVEPSLGVQRNRLQ